MKSIFLLVVSRRSIILALILGSVQVSLAQPEQITFREFQYAKINDTWNCWSNGRFWKVSNENFRFSLFDSLNA